MNAFVVVDVVDSSNSAGSQESTVVEFYGCFSCCCYDLCGCCCCCCCCCCNWSKERDNGLGGMMMLFASFVLFKVFVWPKIHEFLLTLFCWLRFLIFRVGKTAFQPVQFSWDGHHHEVRLLLSFRLSPIGVSSDKDMNILHNNINEKLSFVHFLVKFGLDHERQ